MNIQDIILAMCLPESRFYCADPTCREKALMGLSFCPECAEKSIRGGIEQKKRASQPLSDQETRDSGRSDPTDSPLRPAGLTKS